MIKRIEGDDRPILVDLFCGEGGAGAGYMAAGFRVIGVDIVDRHGYPGEFVKADANAFDFSGADAVAGSPPCHDHSALAGRTGADHGTGWMLDHTIERFESSGLPYVVENVEGAKMPTSIILCGTEFGLGAAGRVLKRHRRFAANFPLTRAGVCACRGRRADGSKIRVGGVYGDGGTGQMTRGYKFHPADARVAMGIDWMTRRALSQAIPPAYTQHIGKQLMAHLSH